MSGFSRKFLILSAICSGVSLIDDSSYLVGIGLFVSGMTILLLKSLIDAIFRRRSVDLANPVLQTAQAVASRAEGSRSSRRLHDSIDEDFVSLQERSTNREFFVDIDEDYTQAITD